MNYKRREKKCIWELKYKIYLKTVGFNFSQLTRNIKYYTHTQPTHQQFPEQIYVGNVFSIHTSKPIYIHFFQEHKFYQKPMCVCVKHTLYIYTNR